VKPLKFSLRARPPCRVDASVLNPAVLAGRSAHDIAQLRLPGWGESYAVGDLFKLSGDDPSQLILDGLDGSFVRVGAGLDGGNMTVTGHAGDYVGESMKGGSLTVRGTVGDYAGASLRGGTLSVHGDAGAFLAAARAGETKGMAGGCIVVHGNAGDRAGDRMRRGLLLIEGNAGEYCGSRMLAGTVLVLKQAGALPGYQMRRGTLLLSRGATLPPTFNYNGVHDLLFVRLLLEKVATYGPAFRRYAKQTHFARWLGDLGCEGKGEIMMAAA
jgi:formylmethanofuran dehydrogenase subunit C